MIRHEWGITTGASALHRIEDAEMASLAQFAGVRKGIPRIIVVVMNQRPFYSASDFPAATRTTPSTGVTSFGYDRDALTHEENHSLVVLFPLLRWGLVFVAVIRVSLTPSSEVLGIVLVVQKVVRQVTAPFRTKFPAVNEFSAAKRAFVRGHNDGF